MTFMIAQVQTTIIIVTNWAVDKQLMTTIITFFHIEVILSFSLLESGYMQIKGEHKEWRTQLHNIMFIYT